MREHNNDFGDLDDIIVQGISQFTEEWIATYPDPNELKDKYEFSDKCNKRMERMIKHHNSFFYRITRTSKMKVASILVLAFLAANVLLLTNDNAQASAREFFTKVFTEFTDIFFIADNELKEIEQYYAPSYIPEGYEIARIYDNPTEFGINYIDENENIATYSQSLMVGTGLNADTENINNEEVIEEIEINNNTAILIYNKVNYSLHWNDGIYRYTIVGKSQEEIIQIAQSLENFEKN